MKMMKKICIFCGASLTDPGTFCTKCGKKQSVKKQSVRVSNDNNIKPLIIEFINKIPDINQGTFYQRENIPNKKLQNALSNIAPGIKASEIVFYVDMTVWGSGKEGLVFTKDKLYWSDMNKKMRMIEYANIKDISLKGNDLRINSNHISLIIPGNEETIKDLLILFKTAKPNIVEKLKQRKDINGLIKALRYKNSVVRENAAKALDELNWEPKDEVEKIHYLFAKQYWHELEELGDPALKILIKALKDKDHNVRLSAANALGRIGDEKAVGPLIIALQDRRLIVVTEVTKALVKIGDTRVKEIAIKHLIQILKIYDAIAKSLTIQTLASIGEPAVEPLIQALEDENLFVRWGAASALGLIGDTRAVNPLVQVLNDKKKIVGVAAKDALERLDKLKEVEEKYRDIIRKKPNLAEPHCNLGTLLELSNRIEEAETEYREAVSLNPNYATAYYNLGTLLTNSNKFLEAEKELREAIRIKPEYVEAHDDLGILLNGLNKFSEAEKEFKEAIRINPYYLTAHYNLGTLLTHLNELSEAEKEFKVAIMIDPNFPQAHSNLGVILQGLNRIKEAKIELAIAIDLFKKEGNFEKANEFEEFLQSF